MFNKKFFIILLILISNISKIFSQKCTTNLDCKNTGCCHDDRCSDKSECRRRNKLCYAFVGVGAFVVLIIIIIYFVCKIKETKKHLQYLKKTDPSTLAHEEQIRQARKLSTQTPLKIN